MKNKFQEVRIPIRIPMSISSSRLSEPGKCIEKPLIALPDQPNGAIYRLFEIPSKPRSYLTSIDERTTIAIRSGITLVILRVVPSILPAI